MSYGYNRDNGNRSNRWQDWVNLALATWFFFSPWILQFAGNALRTEPATGAAGIQGLGNAPWNAWVLSVIVFLLALSAINRMELWQELLTLLLGAWIFVAPWILGFAPGSYPGVAPAGAAATAAQAAVAAWDHWIVGALIFLVSATSLWQRQVGSSPPGEPFRR